MRKSLTFFNIYYHILFDSYIGICPVFKNTGFIICFIHPALQPAGCFSLYKQRRNGFILIYALDSFGKYAGHRKLSDLCRAVIVA